MFIHNDSFPITDLTCTQRTFLSDDMLFLDIETTGLSPAGCRIYCIGCAWCQGSEVVIRLYFTEKEADEPLILRQFLDEADRFGQLVTFNGNTFDLPFLEKRARFHHIPCFLNRKKSVDIFRDVRKCRSLLRLPDYKQKTLEQFLGCYREDIYTGGELISLYLSYETTHSEELLQLLLLHNLEDIKGMFQLVSIYSYLSFLGGEYSIDSFYAEPTLFSCESSEWMINVILSLKEAVPQSVHIRSEQYTLFIDSSKAVVQFPVFHGELRHYFSNYKDYYYLPDEQTIIHKSIGTYVDRDHREKATKQNCYLPRECLYIQGNRKIRDSYLKKDDKDPFLYLDVSGLCIPGPDWSNTESSVTTEIMSDFIHQYDIV